MVTLIVQRVGNVVCKRPFAQERLKQRLGRLDASINRVDDRGGVVPIQAEEMVRKHCIRNSLKGFLTEPVVDFGLPLSPNNRFEG